MENFDYERELSKCKTLEDITGKNGLVQRIVKDAIEKILQKEFNEHLENTSANTSSGNICLYASLHTLFNNRNHPLASFSSTFLIFINSLFTISLLFL